MQDEVQMWELVLRDHKAAFALDGIVESDAAVCERLSRLELRVDEQWRLTDRKVLSCG